MTTYPQEENRHDVIHDPSKLPAGAIVIAVDASVSDTALDWAIDQAVAERRPLVLAHAAGPAWAERSVIDPDRTRSWRSAAPPPTSPQ